MSQRFQSIAMIGISTLSKEELGRVQKLSAKRVRFTEKLTKTDRQTIEGIGQADGLLASRHLKINARILDSVPQLKYIGIYGTSLENVDVEAVRARGIELRNVPKYYDYDIVEYILAELLQAVRGLGTKSWWKAPSSLAGKKLGIVGVGPVGTGLARIAPQFKMETVYFDFARNPEVEKMGIPFCDFETLLRESDIVSINIRVPSPMFLKKHFKLLKEGAILISISDGEVLKLSAFGQWIKNPRNLALFDGIGGIEYRAFRKRKNVSISKHDAYVTVESFQRLGRVFFANLEEYLGV